MNDPKRPNEIFIVKQKRKLLYSQGYYPLPIVRGESRFELPTCGDTTGPKLDPEAVRKFREITDLSKKLKS
jgi:hypothetical protein